MSHIELPIDESQPNAVWQRHAGVIAWPTIALIGGVILSEVSVVVLVLQQQIPLWVGSLIATLNAYLAFTVAHEASHGNIRGSNARLATLEAAVGWIAAGILFVPYSGFRAIHLLHHAHVNDPERDPDHWVAGSNPLDIAARCFTIAAYYYYALLVGSASGTKIGRRVRVTAIAFLVVLWSTFATLIWTGYGDVAIYLWLLPSVLAVGILGFSFDWLPHHPHSTQERYHDTRILLIPSLTLPMMWQNFHLIHHLHPRVPFYRYARCFRDLRSHLESKGASIEGYETGLDRPFAATAADPAIAVDECTVDPGDSEPGVLSHRVTVRQGAQVLSFDALESESVLAAALRQGIDLQWACGAGNCGTCMLKLNAGEVDHREDTDALLESERADGFILVCSSRALSALELEDAS